MRYLILSDTHGRIQEAATLIEIWRHQIDGVWHLGDHASDFARLKKQYASIYSLAFSGVAGNCDPPSDIPYRRLFDLEGRRILLCHGHQYHVNAGLRYLQQIAHDTGATVVLFGHTHIPVCTEEDSVLYLNPGSLTSPRGGSPSSFALLEISQGKAAASLMDFSNFG